MDFESLLEDKLNLPRQVGEGNSNRLYLAGDNFMAASTYPWEAAQSYSFTARWLINDLFRLSAVVSGRTVYATAAEGIGEPSLRWEVEYFRPEGEAVSFALEDWPGPVLEEILDRRLAYIGSLGAVIACANAEAALQPSLHYLFALAGAWARNDLPEAAVSPNKFCEAVHSLHMPEPVLIWSAS